MLNDEMRAYYDRRAPEYDDWWNGTGLFTDRERPGWHEEVEALIEALRSMAPARTLDIACGTGFLTRHLPGAVEAIDQSPRMVQIARERGIDARVAAAEDVEGEYERVFTSHFYGHLLPDQVEPFVARARALAPELVVCDSAGEGAQWQERVLDDGSSHGVYKRWFTADALLAELGGGEVLHAGRWFAMVRVRT